MFYMICSAASYEVPHSLSLKLVGEVPQNVVANRWLNGSDEVVGKIYCYVGEHGNFAGVVFLFTAHC